MRIKRGIREHQRRIVEAQRLLNQRLGEANRDGYHFMPGLSSDPTTLRVPTQITGMDYIKFNWQNER